MNRSQDTPARVWTQILEPWVNSFRFPPSQNDVAAALGLKPSTMSNWKLGRTKLTPADAANIAKVTGTPLGLVLRAILLDQDYPIEELKNYGTAIEKPRPTPEEAPAAAIGQGSVKRR